MCCFVFSTVLNVLKATNSTMYAFSYIRWKGLDARFCTNKWHFPVKWGCWKGWACSHFELLEGGGLWRGNRSLMRNIHRVHKRTTATSCNAWAEIHIQIMICGQAVDPYWGAAETDLALSRLHSYSLHGKNSSQWLSGHQHTTVICRI